MNRENSVDVWDGAKYSQFRSSLEYTCPSHGGWGMVRIAMLIPQSHQLFVCPSACGRHGALGAIQQGLKKRLSYLYLEESDVISGYDDTIYDAVDELLERLPQRPKVFIVFVSCIDDLIGTDGEAVIAELSLRYPDIQFRMGHMNPIQSDSDEPPLVTTWKTVYSLMERTADTVFPAVNMLGNYVPIDSKSELIRILKELGIELCHIGNMHTYDELKNMGNHALNLLIAPSVEKIAKELKREQGIEYLKLPTNYNLSEINENYRVLFHKLLELGLMEADISFTKIENILKESEKKAIFAIQKAKILIGEKKINIDYSAFNNPFSAARFFYDNGFSIAKVYAKEMDEEDADYIWLKNHTDIKIIPIKKHDIVNTWKEYEDSISIGLEAAYVSGSRHVVSVFQDEKMYGYHGVCLLMEQLMNCIKEDADLEDVINSAGLVV
ncbi:MAG: oxidoreductase [Lachnospiraceae bacterium]|nr:oxidoreductase [Lachnospiraceae bacterium]